MSEKLDQKEITTTEELCWAKLLIEKGIISEQEFYTKLKQVQAKWESKRSSKQ